MRGELMVCYSNREGHISAERKHRGNPPGVVCLCRCGGINGYIPMFQRFRPWNSRFLVAHVRWKIPVGQLLVYDRAGAAGGPQRSHGGCINI